VLRSVAPARQQLLLRRPPQLGCGSKLDGAGKEEWKARACFEDWNLDDPPAIDPGDLSEYRRVRDEVKAKVLQLLEKIRTKGHIK